MDFKKKGKDLLEKGKKTKKTKGKNLVDKGLEIKDQAHKERKKEVGDKGFLETGKDVINEGDSFLEDKNIGAKWGDTKGDKDPDTDSPDLEADNQRVPLKKGDKKDKPGVNEKLDLDDGDDFLDDSGLDDEAEDLFDW